ncbi:hypothetical protein COY06_05730, partial [Candidatus Peregrinibacteria bacterium CG_4_10_14_0_2_um_filter_41_8]
ESAGFHPYWPFTGQESRDAGLDFVDSINKGLGIDNGRKFTINGMVWVQKWLNSDGVYMANSVSNEPIKETEAALKPVERVEINTPPIIAVVPNETSSLVIEPVTVKMIGDLQLKISVDGPLVVDKQAVLNLLLVKADGSKYDYTYRFSNDPLKIDTDGVRTRFVNGMLEASNFVNGESKLIFMPLESGRLRFNIKNETFVIGSESLIVKEFTDVEANSSDNGIVSYLRKEGVINGYPDGSFQPDRPVARVEALKFVLGSVGVKLDVPKTKVAFADVDVAGWYIDYVSVALKNGVINGYPDGMLRPSEQVNVVEFLKMLFAAMKIDVDPQINSKYENVLDVNGWYAKYLQEGLELGLIDYDLVETPDKGLSRIEVANIVYRLKKNID